MSDEARWIELKDSFATLTDLPSAERSAHLAALRDIDPELYEELCELLDADAHIDAMLARLDLISPASGDARASDTATPPTTSASDAFGLVGRTVSHYRVLDVLGAGATSVVYRAEDLRAARIVALKFPLRKFAADPLAARRFLERARVASTLGHPNVCAVYERGETDDGELFLAMECCPGETLAARLASSGALPITEALRIAEGLLRGLGAAHAAGLVHHSLKPSHVMLTGDAVSDVKILDFGLANARDLAITSGEHRQETVEYMSPEQLDGDTVDGRSDLWSFGVVFYEMLTGKPPFGKGRDLPTVYGILHDDPSPPSAIRVDVPAVCDEVVAGLLRKKPSERPATPEQVLDILASARPAPARSREKAAMLRRRVRPFAVPVAAALIVLALLAQDYLGRRTRPAEGGEVLRLYGQGDFRLLRGQPQLDSALVEFRAAIALDSTFAPAWAALAETDVARSNLASPGLELLRDAETAADRAISLDPRLAEAYTAKAMVLASRGFRSAYDSAETLFRHAIALDSTSARAHHYYSLLLLVQRRDDDAIAENQRALRADSTDPPPRVANALLLLLKGQRRAARDTLRQALAASSSYVVTPSYLGFIEADDGNFADARKHLELARSGGELFPGVRSALAYVYGKRGRADDRDVLLARIRADTSDDRARIDRALSWAVMGDVDGAYARLRDERWDLPSVHNLVVNPLLKRFRADRRYARLTRRIGITR